MYFRIVFYYLFTSKQRDIFIEFDVISLCHDENFNDINVLSISKYGDKPGDNQDMIKRKKIRGYTKSNAIIYTTQVSRLNRVQVQKILYVLEYIRGRGRDQRTD